MSRTRPEPCLRSQLRDAVQGRAADAAGDGGDADPEVAVLLGVHADVVAAVGARGRRRGAVEEHALEVLVLEDVAELLGAPVGHQELQAGAVAQPAVAVVAEDRDDALPDVRDVLQGHPDPEALGEHRVGGEPATDPHVEPGPVLGVLDPDERDVVDLVGDVEAGAAGDRGLELAGQVGELRAADVAVEDLAHGRRAVEHLVGRDAGHRRPEDDPWGVAAGLGGGQADRLEALPDLGHVLDPDPVQLDVLAVGHVGGVAGELAADVGDGAQLVGVERPAVAADPQHEELRVELAGVEGGRLAAVDAGLALGVETPPAHPAAEVLTGDAGEPLLGVDLLDAGPDVEAVVGLLELLVAVQRACGRRRPRHRWPCRPAAGDGSGSASPHHSARSLMRCITVHYLTGNPPCPGGCFRT